MDTTEYRFRDGRVVTVTSKNGGFVYKLDGKTVTDPDQIAALVTEARRGG